MPRKYDLTGRRFGLLVAQSATRDRAGNVAWLCQCDCGNSSVVAANSLTRKRGTRSCGCLHTKQHKTLAAFGTAPARIASSKINKNNSSGFKGVSFNSLRGKWIAYIYFQQKRYFLGYYDNKNDAAEARRQAELNIYGPFLEWYYDMYPGKRHNRSDSQIQP